MTPGLEGIWYGLAFSQVKPQNNWLAISISSWIGFQEAPSDLGTYATQVHSQGRLLRFLQKHRKWTVSDFWSKLAPRNIVGIPAVSLLSVVLVYVSVFIQDGAPQIAKLLYNLVVGRARNILTSAPHATTVRPSDLTLKVNLLIRYWRLLASL